MSARLVNIDRDTPMLLPPDLREWVAADDMVHFVIEAIAAMPLSSLHLNRRGGGSAQYPPKMMLALLIYCYANGVFSSRRIERATYRDVAVRYLTADTHPDHDTICKFRRENFDAIAETFVQVLTLARAMGLLRVGTISVDGTHIAANASKDRNVRYDRAGELERQLQQDIAELMKRAEQTDGEEDPRAESGGHTLPREIQRRENLLAKMRQARAQLEAEAKAKAEAAQAEYERKLAEREAKGVRKGSPPKPPASPESITPAPEKQANLTDGDSKLMRKSKRSAYEQAYNAQAAVDADGSMLIVAQHVTNQANDANELIPAVNGVPRELGEVNAALADTGYANVDAITQLQEREDQPIDLYVAVGRQDNHDQRRYDFRPKSVTDKPTREVKDPVLVAMRAKLRTDEGKKKYAKRKQTVEPVFGIIKSVMGFRQFLLRGLKNVAGEWSLVCLAYNVKRLYSLRGMP